MSEPGGYRGILLAHGTLAEGLANAAARIAGAGPEVLLPLSNDGKAPQALEEELRAILEEGPAVLFTDLASGSCALAARKCLRDDCPQAIVAGVNLPILLDFVFNRHLPLEELLPRLVKKGTEAITAIPHPQTDVDHSLQS